MSGFLDRQKRYGEIMGLLVQHDLSFVLDRLGLSSRVPERFRGQQIDGAIAALSTPERVRRLFEALGPTYVKMGQILSTRPDLIPQPYLVQLKKLQDAATTLPFSEIKAAVEGAFGAELGELFAEVDETPIAAASIGQVHRVTLLDGRPAVIKVQRPGIESAMRTDLSMMRSFAELARGTGVMGPVDPVQIVRVFERAMLRELDFVVEGRSTDLFREQHAADPELVVPEVFWERTNKQVLTLELIDGVKVSDLAALDAAGHDRPRLARKLVEVAMAQIFVHGNFHADPHPGNLLVLADGRLGLIDFGMYGHFDRATRRSLLDLMQDIADRDARRLADHLIQHDLMGYGVDLREVRKQIAALFRGLADAPQGELAELLYRFIIENKIEFPPDLFFLDKVFGTLDGAVKTLDPSLSLRQVAQSQLPALASGAAADWRSMARRFATEMLELDQVLLQLPGDLGRVLKRLDAGHLRVEQRHALSEQGARQLARLLSGLGLMGLGALSAAVGLWASAAGAAGALAGLPAGGLALGVGLAAFAAGLVLTLRTSG